MRNIRIPQVFTLILIMPSFKEGKRGSFSDIILYICSRKLVKQETA